MTRPASATERARDGRSAELALLVAVVVPAVLLAHREALDAWFAADDFLWLEISTIDGVLASFVGPWGHGAAYRPLSRLSFFIDYALFGLDARPWHAHSLLNHAGTATLLGWLVLRVSGERALALAVAVIFALQPLGYQNTVWISGRSHPLAFGWSLLSLIFFDRFLLGARKIDIALAAGFLAASLLTYEAGVYTLPFAALLVLLRRRRIGRWTHALTGLLVLAAATASYFVVRRIFVGPDPMYPVQNDLLGGEMMRRFAMTAGRLLEQLAGWSWVVLGGTLLSLMIAARYFAVACVGCIVALIGYLPFVLVTSFSVRFAYASQAGVALIVAAALCGIARVPRVGKPLAFVLFATLIASEWRAVRTVSHEWQQAGKIGQRALASIVAATPDPATDGVVFVVGTPRTYGRAMVFYTYFDAALRVFQPQYRRLGISAHYVTDLPLPSARGEIAAAWQRTQARRASSGQPLLRCQDGPAEVPGNGSFAALLDCHALVLALDPLTQRATPSSETRLRARLRRL